MLLKNKFENGFEVKEKREKGNWKIKEFKKVVKFIFENLPKVLIPIRVKSIFETLIEFDLAYI